MSRQVLSLLATVLLLLVSLGGAWPAWAGDSASGHRLIGLLDYVAVDYGGAVEGGQVVSDFEFREMGSLAQAAVEIARRDADPRLLEQVLSLQQQVASKADADAVRAASLRARKTTVEVFELVLAPGRAPDFARGQALYATHCVSCHGPQGRAGVPGTEAMEPPPIDFHDPARRAAMSPYRAYNTQTFGVEGTAMVPFGTLSDGERWDLAFYVVALAHSGAEALVAPDPQPMPKGAPSLSVLAGSPDAQLSELLSGSGISLRSARTTLPYLQPSSSSDALLLANAKLDQAAGLWRGGDFEAARALVLSSYLEGFEPVEASLKASDGALVQSVERQYLELRELLGSRDALAADRALEGLRGSLVVADRTLSADTSSLGLAVASASIALREGVEVVLLLALLLGVVGRLGGARARRMVHAGWIGAAVAGLLTWFAASTLIEISGVGRELIEGVVGLLAAAVLFSVSFWFVGQLQGQKWSAFVKAKLQDNISNGRMGSLAGISFLAVYREAFETVLFYQALVLEADGRLLPIVGGIAVSAVLLAGVAFAVFKLGAKLPLRPFFAVSAAALYLICVMLAGSGVHAFVEAGLLAPMFIPVPSVPAIQLYPELVGFSLQALLLLAGLGWVGYNLRDLRNSAGLRIVSETSGLGERQHTG